MLEVRIPPGYEPERRYIIDVLIGDFLGLEYACMVDPDIKAETWLLCPNGRRLVVTDGLFCTLPADWLTPNSMPDEKLAHQEIVEASVLCELIGHSSVPVFVWEGVNPADASLTETSEGGCLQLDVFGMAFFFLSRYEELVSTKRDRHGRFPYAASIAAAHGLAERPIVNEYLEILWYALSRVAPDLRRKSRNFRMLVSHDVDIPYEVGFASPGSVLRSMAGDTVKRKSPGKALERFAAWGRVKTGNWAADPSAGSFDWIMDQCERRSIRTAFYFIAGRTNPRFDAAYEVEHPRIRELIRNVSLRGHEIGLHPSYETYRSAEAISIERSRLAQVCAEEGVNASLKGGRQHFLRWSAPDTWHNWAGAGLDYDSSVGFAEHVGFRCGTCYEFPVFDAVRRKRLSLHERPLMVMEVSLTSPGYMGLNLESAGVCIRSIKNTCRSYSGDFVLLWHNNNLNTPDMKSLFVEALDA